MNQRSAHAASAVTAAVLAFGMWACGGGKNEAPSQTQGFRPESAHSSANPSAAAPEDLKFTRPGDWIPEKPTSTMRKAQYRLPKADGDAEDAEFVVFYFGGGGGGVQMNIDRWIGQFSKPDGSPITEAKTAKKTVHGIPVTTVDVSGTFVGGMGTDTGAKTNYRMLGAVAESSNGPWFFKLTGPAKTVARWEPGFQSLLDSIQ
jgi:hypothetical protein